jgi:GNAT superfamily N-acetyltransferase
VRSAVQDYDEAVHRSGAVRALMSVRRADGGYPPPQDTGDTTEELDRWLFDSPVRARWVAVLDDEVVGHVCLSPAHPYLTRRLVPVSPPTVLLEVGKLYVAAEARGLDLGRRLLEEAMGRAAGEGAVAALAVLPTSRAALGLYRDRGLVEVGQFEGVHGLNLVFVDDPQSVQFVDPPT